MLTESDDVLATACAVAPDRRHPSVLLLLQAVQDALRVGRRRRTLTMAARPGPQLRAWAEAEEVREVRPLEPGEVAATPSRSPTSGCGRSGTGFVAMCVRLEGW
jgi:hypothetical protein